MSPGTVDLILGLALVFFTVKGFFRGFLRSVISLVAVVAAWLLGGEFSQLGAQLGAWGHIQTTPWVLHLIGWVLIFIVIQTVGLVIVGIVYKIGLGFLDRLAGVALGALTGVLIGCLPLALIDSMPHLAAWPPVKNVVEHSQLLRAYTPLVKSIMGSKSHQEHSPAKHP
jgi:membrane protein required for colicin V production